MHLNASTWCYQDKGAVCSDPTTVVSPRHPTWQVPKHIRQSLWSQKNCWAFSIDSSMVVSCSTIIGASLSEPHTSGKTGRIFCVYLSIYISIYGTYVVPYIRFATFHCHESVLSAKCTKTKLYCYLPGYGFNFKTILWICRDQSQQASPKKRKGESSSCFRDSRTKGR